MIYVHTVLRVLHVKGSFRGFVGKVKQNKTIKKKHKCFSVRELKLSFTTKLCFVTYLLQNSSRSVHLRVATWHQHVYTLQQPITSVTSDLSTCRRMWDKVGPPAEKNICRVMLKSPLSCRARLLFEGCSMPSDVICSMLSSSEILQYTKSKTLSLWVDFIFLFIIIHYYSVLQTLVPDMLLSSLSFIPSNLRLLIVI